MDQNKFKYPAYVLTITIGLLLILSFLKTDFLVGTVKLRKIDLLSSLKSKKPRKHIASPTSNDTLLLTPNAITKNKETKVYDKAILSYADSTDNSALVHFMKALDALQNGKRKKVRIAYFGDSMIEGDMISQDLRKMLQKYFGGKGVGFIPVTSISAPNRSSVQHTFSDNWKDANFQNTNWGKYPYGFSGHIFYTQAPDCWFKFKGVKEERLKNFESVKIFYGKADSNQSINVNDHDYPLVQNKAYNIIDISFETLQPAVMVNMGSNINLPVYGASLEGDTGITLDNYSFRGISGIELSEIPGGYFRMVNELYPYDLLILHYGPNLLFKPELTDFSWFEKKMQKTIQHLKKNMPHTSILIIGSADKASLTEDGWETALGVEPLIETQHKLAVKNHCAYWNLYANMGGQNSMVQWAEQNPIMAGKDYTHLNQRGAHRVATMLYKALLTNYNHDEVKR